MSQAYLSENAVAIPCSVFGTCGGCQYQDLTYTDELTLKHARLKEVFEASALGAIPIRPVVPSPVIYHYRNRLDLKLTHRRSGDVHIGFSPFERGPVLEIAACPIAMKPISDFIPQLREEAARKIPKKYRMANLTVRCGDGCDVRWGGIGRHSLKLQAKEYLYTDILGRRIYYGLDTFFQANLSILPKLMEHLRGEDFWFKDTVFFDLYGGVGLFSLCLNDLVLKTINIESNVHAATLAKYNAAANKLGNAEIFEGRVEDLLPGLLQQSIAKNKVLMVDPPRAGLSPEAIRLLNGLSGVGHLVYLSCGPEGLVENLKDLQAGGWQINEVSPFDFFPRTRHLETLVILSRIS